MEKYRKFEDQKNGVNPFIPNSVKKRSSLLKLVYLFIQIPIGIFFFLSFLFFFFMLSLINLANNLIVVKSLKRLTSVYAASLAGKSMLFFLGVYSLNYKYRKHSNKKPDIIINSQSSVIDWVYLIYLYAPKFLWIVKSLDSKNDFFIELSTSEIFFYSIGLRFPNLQEKPNLINRKFDIEKYFIETEKDRQLNAPLVILPECTKTNRKGVLQIKSNLMDQLIDVIKNNQNLILRGEILSKNSEYFTLHNTTDVYGFKSLFYTCCEIFNNKVEIYAQDIFSSNFLEENNKNKEEGKDAMLQFYLYEPSSRQSVSLSSFDHQSFLTYYHQTAKNHNYVKKNE